MARALQRTPSEISVAPSGPQSAAADRYERVRLLGQGSYGKVYLVRERRSGETLVMKVISLAGLSKKDRAESLREAETLQKISHPNIIRYVESFVANRTLYIVTEHAAKGDLERLIQSRMGRRLPEDQIVRIFTQVCAAVAHLHEHHIIHRDLKPANIFIAADGSVKIGDFGLAKVLAHTMACAKTACGTPYYMAPEICQERPYHNRSDVWALGCILYNMLSGGKHPFDARDLRGLFAKITRGSPEPLSGVPAEARQLVTQLLQRDPRQRPSVTQITSSPYLWEALSRSGAVTSRSPPRPRPSLRQGWADPRRTTTLRGRGTSAPWRRSLRAASPRQPRRPRSTPRPAPWGSCARLLSSARRSAPRRTRRCAPPGVCPPHTVPVVEISTASSLSPRPTRSTRRPRTGAAHATCPPGAGCCRRRASRRRRRSRCLGGWTTTPCSGSSGPSWRSATPSTATGAPPAPPATSCRLPRAPPVGRAPRPARCPARCPR
eukprot:TRINITY_DN247_c4_g1_i1.p1 TRINITY_DN247_c4_g1~~TRINITY_DN247_c4_g1_i1.p1  ORF type:complete len:530 (+),score=74.40 TRINITY_DN247_c4_g1_i1:114-1592(+)